MALAENLKFTRRNFIQGAAVLGATGLLAGCNAADGGIDFLGTAYADEGAVTADEIFRGSCRGNCGGGCYLNVHVRDGQIVRTTAADLPDTQYNRICSKGVTQIGRVYSANRLLYPMKRVGERGSDDFERISWDEAIDTIVEKWAGYREEFGNTSIMFMMGSGNYSLASGTSNGIGGYQRFINVLNCSYCSIDVDVGLGYGFGRCTGGIDTHNELPDIMNAKVVINWGSNPTISLPQTMHFFMEAQEAGIPYIVIDPIFNANSAKADWWIPIKAGTDGALALGVLNTLFANDWIDEDILMNRTNAGLLIKEDDGKFVRMSDLGLDPIEGDPDPTTGEPTIMDLCMVIDAESGEPVPFSETTKCVLKDVGEVAGIKVRTVYEDAMSYIEKWPASTVADFCGLKEEDVIELARIYHEDGPVWTNYMMGMNHYRNAHYNGWPVALIPILTDNIGKSGANFGATEEYLPNIMNMNFAPLYPVNAEGVPAAGQANTIHTNNVRTIQETGRYEFADQDITLKSLYVHGTNPVATLGDHDYTMEWFNGFEFVVVADVCMTETCKHADIVLPAAYWYEQEDVGCLFSTHPYLTIQDKCIEPLGEAKPDFDIWGEILEGLGLGDYWCTAEEFMTQMLDSDAWEALGVSYQALKEEGAQRIYGPDLFIGPAETFATETGRAQMYQETVQVDYDCEREWDESIEHGLHFETPYFAGEDREYRKEYPYHLISEHMRTHTHTQWWENPLVREYEPEPVLRMNPQDAEALGIAEGDAARIYNDQGSVTMRVALSAALRPGTVSSGRSWQQEDFIDGHYASLPSREFNPCIANHAFNDVAVKIEKA